MDPSLSWSSTEDVSQLSPAHDNNTEISSSDIIKSKGKAPESSSDNELEAGSGLREWTGNTLNYANSPEDPTLGPIDLSSFVSRIDGLEWEVGELLSLDQGWSPNFSDAGSATTLPFSQSSFRSKEDEYITVKAKAGEDEEKMNIHEAICLKCSEGLKYADNVLKMKCKCKTFALIHDCCPSDKDCSNCKHPIEYVPVTLLPSEDSHQTSSDGQVIIRRSRLRMLFNKLIALWTGLKLALKKGSDQE